jgi:ribosome-associated heat shock protein Hsp15
METAGGKVRIDKWLWAARFFKTRSLAAEAVNGGKVHINGNRIKQSHEVRVGDIVQIRKGPYQFIVIVKEASAKRGPALSAAMLSEETQDSRTARELLAEQLRLAVRSTPRPVKRPDKRQRRQIIRFTGKGRA